MKSIIVILISLSFSFYGIAKEKIEINALKSVELSYEEFADFDVKLINTSGKPIDVAVINPETNKQVSGFGLGTYGKATLYVAKGNILKLKNNNLKDVSISIEFVEREKKVIAQENTEMIQFTLRNSSLKSIPLVIPNVMNPNLSPMSNSGVSLKMGQKIYYKKGLSKILILTVDESIKAGDKIDMAQLIKNL